MPIYEYFCHDCQKEFEQIRPMREADTAVNCVDCHGQHVVRQISLFNAASGGRSLTSAGCSGCAGGSCQSCGPHR